MEKMKQKHLMSVGKALELSFCYSCLPHSLQNFCYSCLLHSLQNFPQVLRLFPKMLFYGAMYMYIHCIQYMHMHIHILNSCTLIPMPKHKWDLCCGLRAFRNDAKVEKALSSTTAPLTIKWRSGVAAECRLRAFAHFLLVLCKSSLEVKEPTLISWLARFHVSFDGVSSIRQTSIW